MVQRAGGVGVDPGEPGGRAISAVCEHVADGAGSAGRGQQGERGQAAPEHEPGGLGRAAADDAFGHGGRAGVAVGGPEQDGEDRVEDDRPRGAVDRAGGSGQDAAEALAEPPHGQRPRDRRGEREPQRGAPGDAEAQGELGGGEEGVQHDHVVVDEARRPGDRAGHHGGIAVRAPGQHVREALGEHGRLVLQDAVQHPDDAEGQLELAARVERGRADGGGGAGSGAGSGAGGGAGRRSADREALAHVVPPFAKLIRR